MRSAGRSAYPDATAATVEERSEPLLEGTHVHLLRPGARVLFVAAGQYVMDPGQLARFREAVADDRQGGELVAILRKLTRAGFTVRSHDVLQRVPRGLDPNHPRGDLLKRKGLIVTFPEPPRELLVARTLIDWLARHAKEVVPLVEGLASVAE